MIQNHTAPGAGLDKAPVRAPAWCAHAPHASWSPGSVASHDQEFITHHYWSELIAAASYACGGDPSDARVQAVAAELEQQWINMTGLSDKDAVASLAARVNPDAFTQGQTKLCAQLTVPDEVMGEDRVFMTARRALFGCDLKRSPGEGLWSDGTLKYADVVDFLDQSAVPADELVRLAFVVDRSKSGFRDKIDDAAIAMYAIDNIDYRALSNDKVLAMLKSAPYAGNEFATVMVKESLAHARLGIAALDAEVKKRTTDADWKEVLLDAPRRAVDAYTAAAAKNADAIKRSNAFEHALFGASKKEVFGCEPKLRADLVAVLHKLPHANATEIGESLGDPIAALLFERLIACTAIDVDSMVAEHLHTVEKRHVRGPRSAAFYATIEAVGKIGLDRPRFPLKPSAFAWFEHARDGVGAQAEAIGATGSRRRDAMGWEGEGGKGIVSSVETTRDGVVVTFVHKSHQEMAQECHDTNRIYGIDMSSGKIIYYSECHNTHLVTINDTPEPVTIAAPLAVGIKAGVLVEFIATRGRWGFPLSVYADKEHKQLVSFEGFAL